MKIPHFINKSNIKNWIPSKMRDIKKHKLTASIRKRVFKALMNRILHIALSLVFKIDNPLEEILLKLLFSVFIEIICLIYKLCHKNIK